MDNNRTGSADDIGYLCQLRVILRFLAQKALEYIRWCMRWFLGLFSATTVLVKCTTSNRNYVVVVVVRAFRFSVFRWRLFCVFHSKMDL